VAWDKQHDRHVLVLPERRPSVGQRLFFAVPRATSKLLQAHSVAAGQNKVPPAILLDPSDTVRLEARLIHGIPSAFSPDVHTHCHCASRERASVPKTQGSESTASWRHMPSRVPDWTMATPRTPLASSPAAGPVQQHPGCQIYVRGWRQVGSSTVRLTGADPFTVRLPGSTKTIGRRRASSSSCPTAMQAPTAWARCPDANVAFKTLNRFTAASLSTLPS